MLRYLTKKRKQQRKDKNHDAVKEIYKRATSTVAAERLVVHQESDPARVEKIKAAAQARRERRRLRNAGRNQHASGT